MSVLEFYRNLDKQGRKKFRVKVYELLFKDCSSEQARQRFYDRFHRERVKLSNAETIVLTEVIDNWNK